ncbi:uncharacterized protein LOC126351169 isoform X1 [Schistocerca gregaria]|uniref:uncharacterized protein LOC126351169 isoform X1 n=1 Tax=Schistocerca gregaria TaxID=7010 RepID=UPI00211F309E|nr:uncharacterized protein LOC126351169 isoform X1 [Schistocerca gregaria]
MGTCFGKCPSTESSKRAYQTERSKYSKAEGNVEFDFLVDERKDHREEAKWPHCISCLLPLRRKKVSKQVILELTDDTWTRADEYQRSEESGRTSGVRTGPNAQAQPLDARSLLMHKSVHQMATRDRSITSSTPPSSLDLEWEHEGVLPIHAMHYAGVPEEDVCDSSATNGKNGASSTGWSRISTPDSLEWDPVEAPLAAMSEAQAELDAETEQLLTEIERLTSRALRETGDWSS